MREEIEELGRFAAVGDEEEGVVLGGVLEHIFSSGVHFREVGM